MNTTVPSTTDTPGQPDPMDDKDHQEPGHEESTTFSSLVNNAFGGLTPDEYFNEHGPEDFAKVLASLPEEEAASALASLPEEDAASILLSKDLNTDQKATLLSELFKHDPDKAVAVLENMIQNDSTIAAEMVNSGNFSLDLGVHFLQNSKMSKEKKIKFLVEAFELGVRDDESPNNTEKAQGFADEYRGNAGKILARFFNSNPESAQLFIGTLSKLTDKSPDAKTRTLATGLLINTENHADPSHWNAKQRRVEGREGNRAVDVLLPEFEDNPAATTRKYRDQFRDDIWANILAKVSPQAAKEILANLPPKDAAAALITLRGTMPSRAAVLETDLNPETQTIVDLADDIFEAKTPEDRLAAFNKLEPTEQAQVLAALPLDVASELFNSLEPDMLHALMSEMSPGDIATIFDEMNNDQQVQSILNDFSATSPAAAIHAQNIKYQYHAVQAGALRAINPINATEGMLALMEAEPPKWDQAVVQFEHLPPEKQAEVIDALLTNGDEQLAGELLSRSGFTTISGAFKHLLNDADYQDSYTVEGLIDILPNGLSNLAVPLTLFTKSSIEPADFKDIYALNSQSATDILLRLLQDPDSTDNDISKLLLALEPAEQAAIIRSLPEHQAAELLNTFAKDDEYEDLINLLSEGEPDNGIPPDPELAVRLENRIKNQDFRQELLVITPEALAATWKSLDAFEIVEDILELMGNHTLSTEVTAAALAALPPEKAAEVLNELSNQPGHETSAQEIFAAMSQDQKAAIIAHIIVNDKTGPFSDYITDASDKDLEDLGVEPGTITMANLARKLSKDDTDITSENDNPLLPGALSMLPPSKAAELLAPLLEDGHTVKDILESPDIAPEQKGLILVALKQKDVAEGTIEDLFVDLEFGANNLTVKLIIFGVALDKDEELATELKDAQNNADKDDNVTKNDSFGNVADSFGNVRNTQNPEKLLGQKKSKLSTDAQVAIVLALPPEQAIKVLKDPGFADILPAIAGRLTNEGSSESKFISTWLVALGEEALSLDNDDFYNLIAPLVVVNKGKVTDQLPIELKSNAAFNERAERTYSLEYSDDLAKEAADYLKDLAKELKSKPNEELDSESTDETDTNSTDPTESDPPELDPTEPNPTEPNPTEPNPAESVKTILREVYGVDNVNELSITDQVALLQKLGGDKDSPPLNTLEFSYEAIKIASAFSSGGDLKEFLETKFSGLSSEGKAAVAKEILDLDLDLDLDDDDAVDLLMSLPPETQVQIVGELVQKGNVPSVVNDFLAELYDESGTTVFNTFAKKLSTAHPDDYKTILDEYDFNIQSPGFKAIAHFASADPKLPAAVAVFTQALEGLIAEENFSAVLNLQTSEVFKTALGKIINFGALLEGLTDETVPADVNKFILALISSPETMAALFSNPSLDDRALARLLQTLPTNNQISFIQALSSNPLIENSESAATNLLGALYDENPTKTTELLNTLHGTKSTLFSTLLEALTTEVGQNPGHQDLDLLNAMKAIANPS